MWNVTNKMLLSDQAARRQHRRSSSQHWDTLKGAVGPFKEELRHLVSQVAALKPTPTSQKGTHLLPTNFLILFPYYVCSGTVLTEAWQFSPGVVSLKDPCALTDYHPTIHSVNMRSVIRSVTKQCSMHMITQDSLMSTEVVFWLEFKADSKPEEVSDGHLNATGHLLKQSHASQGRIRSVAQSPQSQAGARVERRTESTPVKGSLTNLPRPVKKRLPSRNGHGMSHVRHSRLFRHALSRSAREEGSIL